MRTRIFAPLAIVGAFFIQSVAAWSYVPTTADRTIEYNGASHRLQYGPGERHMLRRELCSEEDCPDTTPKREILHFGQITDVHAIDGESPARVESTDGILGRTSPLSGAYRPQEELGVAGGNAAAQTLNQVESPFFGSPIELIVQTGDNADNGQQNEIEWNKTIFDGGEVDPDSGDPSYRPGLCGLFRYPTRPYQGVRSARGIVLGGGYWEPDRSRAGDDGLGYNPDASLNIRSRQRDVAVPDFPGILEQAQDRFLAPGVDKPWYTVFGNHDREFQGNFEITDAINRQATGCLKDLNGDFLSLEVVQPDRKRKLLSLREWIATHFDSPSEPGPVGHGFDRARPDQPYYNLEIAPGIRLVGLFTVNEKGGAGGVIREPEWQWIRQQLEQARDNGDKLIFVHHHSLRTTNWLDLTGPHSDQHCGLIGQRDAFGRDCEALTGNKSLEWLFYQYPGIVLADINGHEHENNVELHQDSNGPGGFPEFTTASEIDAPVQNSSFSLVETNDGALEWVRTLIDTDVPVDPGSNPDLGDPDALASILRLLAFNDYQGRIGRDGMGDARGELRDRNVIVPTPIAAG